MRYLVMLIGLSIALSVNSQVLRHADSLYSTYYNNNIKRKKIKFHIWFHFGTFSELDKPEPLRKFKTDTLNIASLIKTDEKFQLAFFKENEEPVVLNFDTCSVYDFLQKNKDSIPQIGPYFKIKKQAAESGFLKEQLSGYFESIFIRIGRDEYFFGLDNSVYDTYGNYVSNDYWYPKVRLIIDYLKSWVN